MKDFFFSLVSISALLKYGEVGGVFDENGMKDVLEGVMANDNGMMRPLFKGHEDQMEGGQDVFQVLAVKGGDRFKLCGLNFLKDLPGFFQELFAMAFNSRDGFHEGAQVFLCFKVLVSDSWCDSVLE